MPNLIKVLVIFANPSGTVHLNLGREDRIIREAIESSPYREGISLDFRHATTIHALRRALLRDEFHIVHISGHGTGDGLIMEDEQGNKHLVPQEALAALFGAYAHPKGPLECVILNACYSLHQGSLISLNIPFTIAMEGPVGDIAAIEFSRGFYDAVGAHKEIEFAYGEGIRNVALTASSSKFASKILKRGEISNPDEFLNSYSLTTQNRSSINVKLNDLIKTLPYGQDQINIYVPIGNGWIINNTRDQFVEFISKELNKNESLKKYTFKFFPEELQHLGLEADSVFRLLHDDFTKWVGLCEKMIELSQVIIVPVLFADDVGKAGAFTKLIKTQLDLIKKAAVNRSELKLYYLLNVPAEMFDEHYFKEAFANTAINTLKNVNSLRDRDYANFTQFLISDLAQTNDDQNSDEDNNNIYLLESYVASFSNRTRLSEEEKRNRGAFKRDLQKENNVLTFKDTGKDTSGLSDAYRKHRENIMKSNCIIIYKGASDGEDWWLTLEADTFDILRSIKKSRLKRAIYIDPEEKERDRGSYGFYGYRVLLETPNEVVDFLNNPNFKKG